MLFVIIKNSMCAQVFGNYPYYKCLFVYEYKRLSRKVDLRKINCSHQFWKSATNSLEKIEIEIKAWIGQKTGAFISKSANMTTELVDLIKVQSFSR